MGSPWPYRRAVPLVAVWWFAYEMKDNIWIAFARDRIDLHVPLYGDSQPNQLLGLNPFLILILVPTLNLFWKWVDRDGTRFPSPTKMLLGFLLMAATYMLMSSAGFLAGSDSRVSIFWMVAAFFVMTVSEVMVSVIGLELAFRAAPPRMKSLVTACWLLSVFAGNLIGIGVASLVNQVWGRRLLRRSGRADARDRGGLFGDWEAIPAADGLKRSSRSASGMWGSPSKVARSNRDGQVCTPRGARGLHRGFKTID